MLTNKIILNKFYLYKSKLVKVTKIHKTSKTIFLKFVEDETVEGIPESGAPILLTRLYTIGELARVTEKRSDTIRKYEKRGLIPKPSWSSSVDDSYNKWRFYTEDEVYDVISFFSTRSPGRPSSSPIDVKTAINTLKQKVSNL